MVEAGFKNPSAKLEDLGLGKVKKANWNFTPAELVEHTLQKNMGVLNNTGALVVDTGEFTGRSPKDRFIVKDDYTEKAVDWGNVNLPFSPENFDKLYDKVTAYLADKEVYVRDAYACADKKYKLNIRVVTEFPWQNMFASNMFLRPTKEEISNSEPDWHVIAAPGFMANPDEDGTRQHNFAIINFSKKKIIIGGTAYTGEIKKGIFSVLNFVLPYEHKVLAMHCSSNIGKKGDVSVFFGLSGTGKTTLSADPDRSLIGDDEHGWSEDAVFNFEGGCYAKCIDLSEKKEPEIFAAIKFGAILENIKFFEGTRTVNYEDTSITQNTRVSYPLHHIENSVEPSRGGIPQNIFFLTADAFGVLPPISKLTPGQAMFHFISGYTAKVAGTEEGVKDPEATFSACFGAPFMPLHPTYYAEMLGKKMKENKVKIWLINTGWTGGPFGIGSRMKLKYTRSMITAALNGQLNNVIYDQHPVFGLAMPETCPDVPSEVLNPRNTWADKSEYDRKANVLADKFNTNFEKFADQATEEILQAAPKKMTKA